MSRSAILLSGALLCAGVVGVAWLLLGSAGPPVSLEAPPGSGVAGMAPAEASAGAIRHPEVLRVDPESPVRAPPGADGADGDGAGGPDAGAFESHRADVLAQRLAKRKRKAVQRHEQREVRAKRRRARIEKREARSAEVGR